MNLSHGKEINVSGVQNGTRNIKESRGVKLISQHWCEDELEWGFLIFTTLRPRF
jgi:hypothetical protein